MGATGGRAGLRAQPPHWALPLPAAKGTGEHSSAAHRQGGPALRRAVTNEGHLG